jgi:hypothetical protein
MVEEFSALAGEKRGTMMVLPSLFVVPPDLLVAVFNEPEMKADVMAVGVIKAFHDSVSDEVEVPEALLAFLWAVSQGGLGSIPLTYPVHKPAEAGELAWRTIQRLMTVNKGKLEETKDPREVGMDIETHASPQHPKGQRRKKRRTAWRSHSGTMKIRDMMKKDEDVIESARSGRRGTTKELDRTNDSHNEGDEDSSLGRGGDGENDKHGSDGDGDCYEEAWRTTT